MKRLLVVFSACALLGLAGPAAAWDDQGHMMVAAVAYEHLTDAAKARVAQLMALNKYPTAKDAGPAPADAAEAAFVLAATGPDVLKGYPSYINDGENPANAPDASRNSGFDDLNMHKYWHFTDIPFSTDGTALGQTPTVNAQERIALFRKTLASDAPDGLKAYDLVWLLHLVGDVHQPLHATSRFSKEQPTGDIGGNAVKLCASPCKDELHAFWDGVLGNSDSANAAIIAARMLPNPDSTLAAVSDEAIWVRESFLAAKSNAYMAPIGAGPGPYTLTASYQANATKVALTRVALAGTRLANLLNKEMK